MNVLFQTRFSDLCYGYNAFWSHVLPTLQLPDTGLPPLTNGKKIWGDGFEIETLINVRAAQSFHGSIVEIPSIEKERIHGESNLHAVKDGLRVLRTIGSERLRAWRTPPHNVVSIRTAGHQDQAHDLRRRVVLPPIEQAS